MYISPFASSRYRGLRSPIEHLAMLFLLGGLHFGLFFGFAYAAYHPAPSIAPPDAFVTVFIRPRIREAGEPISVVDPASLRLPLDRGLLALLPQPVFDVSVARNDSAAMAAPTLRGDGHEGMQPYLQQAGLSAGEGATVVLRVEVLESGDPGRIEIDASSGSRKIDQAAVDYARTQHWYAGRVNGAPHSMWIRWGVRLQA